MRRSKLKSISFLVVLLFSLVLMNGLVFASSEINDENFAASVLNSPDKVDICAINNQEEDIPTQMYSYQEKGVPTFACSVWAKLSQDKKKKNFIYYGTINSTQPVNKLSVRAELQYASPSGGKWIKEAEVPVSTTYNSSSAETFSGIYGSSWGQWRCKAVVGNRGTFFLLANG